MFERLWDDSEFEAEYRRRRLAEARRWDGDRLADDDERFLNQCAAVGWPRLAAAGGSVGVGLMLGELLAPDRG